MVTRVEGRNILDENFGGANTRDMSTGRFSKEKAVGLSNLVREATSVGFSSNQKFSQAAGQLTQNIGSNTEAIQKALEAGNDELKDSIYDLIKLLEKGQGSKSSEESKKINAELIRKIETMREMKGGQELSSALDLDSVKQKSGAGNTGVFALGDKMRDARSSIKDFRENINKDGFKSAISQATGKMVEGAKEEYSYNKLFGRRGLFGLGSSKEQKELIAQRENKPEKEQKKLVTDALMPLAEETGLVKEKSISEVRAKNDKKAAGERKVANAKGGVISTGLDSVPQAQLQTTLLEDILAELKKLNEKSFGGGGGGIGEMIPDIPMGPNRGGKPGKPPKSPGRFSRMMNKIPRGLKVGGALAAGAAIYEGYQGYQAADQLVESEAINEETGTYFTQQDETAGKTEAVTSAAGGFAGSLAGASAGATYGAMLGSVVPGVGTVIGGAAGGLIGGALGYFAGSAAGGAIGDAATTTSGEAALSAAEESGLYDKDYLGNSEINPEVLAQTTDPTQLHAILNDDDLSDEDKQAVQARLEEIENAAPALSPGQQRRNERKASLDKKEEVARDIAQKMGIEDDNIEAEVRMGKIVKINGQDVPEELQNESRQRMYPSKSEAERSVVPTGQAVENTTEAAQSATGANAAPVVNNVTNNTSTAAPAPVVSTVPAGPRKNTSSLDRYQDRRASF